MGGKRTDIHLAEGMPVVVVVRSLVEEEARTLEVGEVHSPEAGIVVSIVVVVVDSHVAGRGRGSKTCRRGMRRAARLFQFFNSFKANSGGRSAWALGKRGRGLSEMSAIRDGSGGPLGEYRGTGSNEE